MANQLRSLCSATMLATLAWTAPAMARDVQWGINGHPFGHYRGVSLAQQLDYVKDLGLTVYRVDVEDERVVPKLRTLVRLGKERGITILPVVTPNVSLTALAPDEIYKRAFDRAVALVTPLQDDIRIWELGNEVENYAIIQPCEKRDNGERYNCSWGPAGGVSPLDYFGPRWVKASALIRGLTDGVKSVDPKIRRAIGTAGWGHIGAFERFKADGIEWDISVWHLYGQDPEWALKRLAKFGKPIWITEFNHPGGSSDGASAQAEGLVRQMKRLNELAGTYDIEAAMVYELMDEPYWAPSYEAWMGLVTLENTSGPTWRAGPPKPAYTGLKTYLAGKPHGGASAGTTSALQPARNCDLPHATSGDRSLPPRVAYAYCLILGRGPDGAGMQGWLARLRQPTPIGDMLEAFTQSAEFNARFGTEKLSNAEYVALLYRVLLMREPDGGGMADYVRSLDAKQRDRPATAKAFITSFEFQVRHPVLSAALETTPMPVR